VIFDGGGAWGDRQTPPFAHASAGGDLLPAMGGRTGARVDISMQGPSELGISQNAKLAQWSRFDDLSSIEVPALVIGARYDTMQPEHLERMAERLPLGRYLYCPKGSHLAMYDDQHSYFSGLLAFLHSL
jgi:proline iminopeptidase